MLLVAICFILGGVLLGSACIVLAIVMSSGNDPEPLTDEERRAMAHEQSRTPWH